MIITFDISYLRWILVKNFLLLESIESVGLKGIWIVSPVLEFTQPTYQQEVVLVVH